MKTHKWIPYLAALLWITGSLAPAQQAPERNRTGQPTAIVLNDSEQEMTIEYQSAGEWRPLKLSAHQDTTVAGDHLRVTTTRQDGAIVTVNLAITAGGKYRLAWNANASVWDITATH